MKELERCSLMPVGMVMWGLSMAQVGAPAMVVVVPIQMHATTMKQLPLITAHVYMFNSPVNPAKMVK